MADLATHACPICHEPTDCPDLCARCARLRSKPGDWTDHPQDDDGDPGYLITATLHAPNGGTLAVTFRHPLDLGGDDRDDDARALLAAFLGDDVTADVEVI